MIGGSTDHEPHGRQDLIARRRADHHAKRAGIDDEPLVRAEGPELRRRDEKRHGARLAWLERNARRVVLRELNDIATITRHVTKRGDKVYFDYLQNRHSQLIVAPFSVRSLPGASVSMPLVWDEVDESLDPRAFTIKTAMERMERMERLGADPVAAVLEEKPDFAAVLGRLAAITSLSS